MPHVLKKCTKDIILIINSNILILVIDNTRL